MMTKHLERRQLPGTSAKPVSKVGTASRSWLLVLTAAAIGIGILGTKLMPEHRADQVTQQDIAARQASFEHVVPFNVAWVPADQVNATLDTMRLPAAERAQLQASLSPTRPSGSVQVTPRQRPMRLASVTVWDTHEQDGDIVTISTAGYRVDVVLTNAPQAISFPVDGTSAVRIVGRHDGGGGITLGVRGPSQEMLMPIMSEGQSLTFPVAAN
jgi:hypothetical protein